jgi:hypothetical protein
MEVSIDLLIKDVIGPVTTGFASLIIFEKVSEIFNDFFINVAKNIGNPNTFIDENHPSIQAIKTNKPNTDTDMVFKERRELIKNCSLKQF